VRAAAGRVLPFRFRRETKLQSAIALCNRRPNRASVDAFQEAVGASNLALLSQLLSAQAADWPMFGRDQTRNSVVPVGIAPTDWDIDSGRNVKWTANLGSATFAAPVVAGGQVYIGANNSAGSWSVTQTKST
jgi:hypothetical protein